MLKFTGHPIYDVGVATVTAFSGKRDPSELTHEDLSRMADFIEREYVEDPFRTFFTAVFTNNAWFFQTAYRRDPQERLAYGQRITRAYAEPRRNAEELCVFTGETASDNAFSKNTAPGRAFRQHIPLMTGEGLINFYPSGDVGLPVSGKAILCIQAFPLGCAKSGGKVLGVHSDRDAITLEFARKFLEYNLQSHNLAKAAGLKQLRDASMTPKTLLIDILLKYEELKSQEQDVEGISPSITAYHLTNHGQSNPLDRRNPPLEIYHLPMEITSFAITVSTRPQYRDEFRALSERAWRLEETSRRRRARVDRPKMNYLYEDLFSLPDNAPQFVRRYFLRIPRRRAYATDPRKYYSLSTESGLVSWKLTQLFLERVMLMDKERVEEIRKLGDNLAEYVAGENDRAFFTAFFSVMNYAHFRNALIKANLRHVRNGNPPLITLDPYITVFEEGYDIARADWRFSRDLVLIRMIEQLHKNGWLGTNKDILPDSEAAKEE